MGPLARDSAIQTGTLGIRGVVWGVGFAGSNNSFDDSDISNNESSSDPYALMSLIMWGWDSSERIVASHKAYADSTMAEVLFPLPTSLMATSLSSQTSPAFDEEVALPRLRAIHTDPNPPIPRGWIGSKV